MKTYSQTGLTLTKQFEGLRLTAYPDQGGIWTIGYGHTGRGVFSGLTITPEQAETLLEADAAAAAAAAAVNRLVTTPINQNQFDALVDFTLNLGCATFARSTLLHDINTGDLTAAVLQFQRWDHLHNTVIPGLLRRRQAEAHLFNTKEEA